MNPKGVAEPRSQPTGATLPQDRNVEDVVVVGERLNVGCRNDEGAYVHRLRQHLLGVCQNSKFVLGPRHSRASFD